MFFNKSVKTAVPDDGKPPGALVLTKLVEESRLEVGDEKLFRPVFMELCFFIFWVVFKKSVKTAVQDDGRPPGALVLTKLSE